MNLSDLRVFLAVARHSSLLAAAEQLHLTPSAVSKALRRLEDSLSSPLFDRSTRQLVLNAAGQLLRERGQHLMALAAQTEADLQGASARVGLHAGGPAILLWRDGPRLARQLRASFEGTVHLQAMYEEEALRALAHGELNVAIVTGSVIDGAGASWSAEWDRLALGSTTLQLVASTSHPLLKQHRPDASGTVQLPVAQVLQHPFACPTRSLLGGQDRGQRSDGWRDDVLPRQIAYLADDLQLLLGFVRRGEALAYLPEAALDEAGLVRIRTRDCPFSCTESVWLVWNRSTAPTWLGQLIVQMAAADEAARLT
ncbi:LysR family transcriptional regulator [Duganella qianjiadongensis]|uniref:LysR family transcriptional regulator n=1 Tax=Duganella qianjiadongensis TaxID=2692176 RepID=A0ABW9VRS8_9BURK|nr:LysR family transcriptional regulator [Duganella qianjiadongensis]MYM41198.1 LysR family transcriptional regulator [Duganella qianjiadongensis]